MYGSFHDDRAHRTRFRASRIFRFHPDDRGRRPRGGEARRPRRHALSARAQRLPAHRPREVDLPELRRRGRVRRHVQPALRRHQSRRRKTSSTSTRSRKTSRGSASSGTRCSSRPTTSSSCIEFAVELIRRGKAYVDSLNADEIREYRGTLTEPGRNSPYRDRPVEENLDLFARMRAGEFADGAHVLRAKIDMASPNINMRDPTLYRIRHATHHRTGDAWCIYPMYDFAHPLSDAIEGITHSLCTLEFEDHRPLYDWLRRATSMSSGDRPQQIEFARLNLNYTVMSKRKLLQLVQQRHVSGLGRSAHADDQRPAAPRLHAGVDPRLLRAHRRREEGKRHRRRAARAQHSRGSEPPRAAGDGRAAAAEGRDHELSRRTGRRGRRRSTTRRTSRPARARCRSRACSTSSSDDFMEDPPKKFFRLSPGKEVRLRCAYFITCTEVVKDDARRDRRAALHLRSGDSRRRCAGRPAGEGDAALGVGRACDSGRSAALRSAVLGRGSGARDGGEDVPRPSESRTRSRCCATAGSSRAWRRRGAGDAVPVRAARLFLRRSRLRPGASSSTAPCRCATPGRRSSRRHRAE